MRYMRIVAAIYASALLASCSEPVAVPSGSDTQAPVDSDLETAELRVGHVRMRDVWVPSGYSLVDMNDRGDLLLGAAWLPDGKKRPLAIPFVGRSINNHRQILGPGLTIFTGGRVTQLPDPCIPFTSTLTEVDPTGATTREVVFNCSYFPVQVSALAENGDALAAYRMDAPGTMISPSNFLKVWRASTQKWQTVAEFGYTEDVHFLAAISDTGVIVEKEVAYIFTSWVSDGHDLSVQGICPNEDYPKDYPLAVNDAGKVVGLVDCGEGRVGVRWSRTGMPTRLGGSASIIDNFGNAAGIRDSDGHAVVWLVDGSAIDLSAAAGGQPATVRKFLKRGQVFGFVGTRAVVWRFGF